MNLFFDLDGTIIDSRERLYVLFQQLVEKSSLTFDEYWNLKKNKIKHEQILKEIFKYSDEELADFQNRWMNKIESTQMLELDKPFENIKFCLDDLRNKNALYLITARQFKDKTISQLENMSLKKYFEDILVTEQKYEKTSLIKECCKFSQNDYIIGDTGIDIKTGKTLGLKTIAVTYGFMSKEVLKNYKPDYLIDDIMDIKKILEII